MKLEYDAEVDAAYLRLGDGEVAESEQVHPGVVLDFDDRGRVIGIEVLHLKKQRPDIDLTRVELETV